MNILVVDDDPLSREGIADFLVDQLGHAVCAVGSPDEAIRRSTGETFELVIADIRMPGSSGIALIEQLREQCGTDCPSFILVTGYADVNSSVQALRLGVVDYLQKPVNVDELARAVNRVRVEEATATADSHVAESDSYRLVFRSDAMARVRTEARKLASQPQIPVLIEGETGTGKEVVARLLHSGEGPFVALNCAAIPDALFESELFGYEEGAFTGARRGGSSGRFEMAQDGTLFLDEINELPLPAQPKLLRALQERKYYRVGGGVSRPINARIVCASNQDLEPLVAAGAFRSDLFYRIAVGRIRLPALRERPDDIVTLAEHFLRIASTHLGKRFSHLGEDARKTLLHHRWPGNVRELRNVIERAVLGDDDIVLRRHHLSGVADNGQTIAGNLLQPGNVTLPDHPIDLPALEREIARKALDKFNGNKTRAAEYLGITRSALRSRLPD